ncbi:DUF998 domain-containing protein [Nocardia rhizosphaerihabitans]|uniref:DUF998 domain-containing protein n=1 Tax=Nocardia rhizosphaerihabitans TaxID=1691570 RepID=UPI00166AE152|nr:DUF998 domain-containing protein [Nocardia rhizosphaerihabitans]
MSIRCTHTLLTAGAAGPVLFVLTYLVNGAVQPDYDSTHDTISTLSLAPHGWIQIANFVVYGVLTLCFAEALRRSSAIRTSGYVSLLVAGAGLVLIGVFPTDPALGFPAGESDAVTAIGTVHSMGALVVFLAFPVAAFAAAGRPFRGWDAFSVATGVLSLAAVGAFFVAFEGAAEGADSPAGLYERLPTLFIGLWQVVFALRVLTEDTARAVGTQRADRAMGAVAPRA